MKKIIAFFTAPIQLTNFILWPLILICWILLMPNTGYYWDVRSWTNWALATNEFGLAEIYKHSDCNYLPGFIYYLKIFGLFKPNPENFYEKIMILKSMVLATEAGLLALGFYILKIRITPLILLFLLSPLWWYNAGVFAQVDGIYSLLVLLSIVLIFHPHSWTSPVIFTLALLMKLQAIQFFPIMLILWLVKFNFKQWLIGISGGVLLFLIVVFPFHWAEVQFVITDSVGHFSKVSVMAFNTWFLWLKVNPVETEDTVKSLLGISYRNWGFIVFATSLLLIPLLFLLKNGWVKTLFRLKNMNISEAILMGVFLNLGFFLFLTQMHERYIHPAMAMGLVYAILSRNWIPWLLLAVAYLLNMDFVMQQWFVKPGAAMQPLASYAAVLFCAAWLYYGYCLIKIFLRITPQYPKG